MNCVIPADPVLRSALFCSVDFFYSISLYICWHLAYNMEIKKVKLRYFVPDTVPNSSVCLWCSVVKQHRNTTSTKLLLQFLTTAIRHAYITHLTGDEGSYMEQYKYERTSLEMIARRAKREHRLKQLIMEAGLKLPLTVYFSKCFLSMN